MRGSRSGDTHVIHLSGEVDLATVSLLEDALAEAESSDAHTIVLDLQEVGFIDSTGLEAIIRIDRRAPGRLALVRGPAVVQRAFEVCGVSDWLRFLDTPSSAKEDGPSSSDPGKPARPSARGAASAARRARGTDAAMAAAVRELRSRDRTI